VVTTPGPGPTTVEELRALYPPATLRSSRKEIDHLDGHCRAFLALSPFCVLGTVDADGGPDMSPRGGDPGFVRVAGPRTAVVPDRPGNHRIDSLRHVVAAPAVSLLVFVPGIDETLRVYGRASVVTLDATSRHDLGLDGKGRTALRIDVRKAFFHCAKAVMRSGLWDQASRVERDSFPTMGQLMHDHAQLEGPVESQEEMLRRYAPTL
jgi:PPOX class probable FMN-dependent enzyme